VGARLRDRVAIVVGAGQTPGDTIGNGRAVAILYAREGARVLCVDRDEASAEETCEVVRREGGNASALHGDVTRSEDCAAMVAICRERFGRLDVLHENVGIAGGDAGALAIEESAWDAIFDTNLKGAWLACKHAIPVMREQGSGSVILISSIAAVCGYPGVGYKVSKAALNALAEQLALANARHHVRVNAIMPGQMNTPMAIEGISRGRGVAKEELIARRDASVPLGAKMGTAWDVAYASLFLASDEARFVTGVVLPVDGGQTLRRG